MKLSVCLGILFIYMSAPLFSQDNPELLVKGYGSIFQVPEATVIPDSTMAYKIAIDFHMTPADGKEINFSLDRVARAINLHHSGGVPHNHLDVQVVAYSKGIHTFLSNEAHNQKFGVDNPNHELIEKLHELGVKMVVCGQSIRYQGVDHTELNPYVDVATSYITALTTFQQKGYVILHF